MNVRKRNNKICKEEILEDRGNREPVNTHYHRFIIRTIRDNSYKQLVVASWESL